MRRLRPGVLLAALGVACSSADDGAPPTASPTPAPAGPTFYRDVEPIVVAKCAGCHAADGAAGFAFDAETAKFSARAIAVKIRAHNIPP